MMTVWNKRSNLLFKLNLIDHNMIKKKTTKNCYLKWYWYLIEPFWLVRRSFLLVVFHLHFFYESSSLCGLTDLHVCQALSVALQKRKQRRKMSENAAQRGALDMVNIQKGIILICHHILYHFHPPYVGIKRKFKAHQFWLFHFFCDSEIYHWASNSEPG